jgi:sulfur-carrier protein adenylyltransferase/sulfurtransferase
VSVRDVDIEEAIRLREAGSTVVDVREPWEWDAGHVAGALHIPLAELPTRFATDLPDRSAPLLVYCLAGSRSERAAQFLAANGYNDVANLKGRITHWPERGGAWDEPAPHLSPAQERRYARQLRLPQIGPEGQLRLADARVLIVGAGGLGSPAAIYLAAAGVGHIGLVDDDVVEESNLHRQPLHSAERIGMVKVDSAARGLSGINPETTVLRHAGRLTPDNADSLVRGNDVVVDGTDRLDARYAINDAAVRQRVPLIHGSIYRWEGQVTTIVPFSGPCYRCLHPRQPPEELAPDCDVAGVVGVVPGLVGMLQATEALKLILGVGEPLVGRLLMVDALGSRFEELTVSRDPACLACGNAAASQAAFVGPDVTTA